MSEVMGAAGVASAAEAAEATEAMPRGRRGLRKYSAKEVGLAAVFLGPSIAIFVAFFYLPFFRLLSWGTYKSKRGGASYEQVGLDQYKDVLTGNDFRHGLAHSFQFVLLTVPAGLILGVLLAVAAHRQLRGVKVFQAIFSSTLASSVAVSSVIFFFIFNPAIGYFRVDWVQSSDRFLFTNQALLAAALPSIWQNLGLAFVIVLAGLQAVPEEVMEAARLDGYGPWRRLTRITLPLISPVLLFLLVILVIFGFQAFAQIEIITNGGPAGASETLVFKIFRSSQDYGRGAVLSIGLFVVTMIVTFVQFVILDRRVHYGN